MEKTNNLELELPSLDDPISLNQINENFEKIDNFCAVLKPELLEEVYFNETTNLGYFDWQWGTYNEWVLKVDLPYGNICIVTINSTSILTVKTTENVPVVLQRLCNSSMYNNIYTINGAFIRDTHTISVSLTSVVDAVIRLYGVRGYDL